MQPDTLDDLTTQGGGQQVLIDGQTAQISTGFWQSGDNVTTAIQCSQSHWNTIDYMGCDKLHLPATCSTWMVRFKH